MMTDAIEEIDAGKRAAAEAAVAEVRDGMLVGIGTGTTAAYAIAALGRRVREGLAITAVATSEASAHAAAAESIVILDLGTIARVDLAIDGVDEIDPGFRAIKGAGGAMLREKIVASAVARMIAIADASKAVDRLGAKPVPLEVLPLARAFVAAAASALGGEPVLRRGSRGTPTHTDQGNIVLDCRFETLDDAVALAARLAAIPGLLGHGLFLSEIDALYLGTPGGVVRRERRA